MGRWPTFRGVTVPKWIPLSGYMFDIWIGEKALAQLRGQEPTAVPAKDCRGKLMLNLM